MINHFKWHRNKLSKNEVSISLTVVHAGISSFVFLFISGNSLPKAELSEFVVSWAVINLISLIFQYSLETLAPKLFADLMLQINNNQSIKRQALIYEVILSLTSAVFWLCFVFVYGLDLSLAETSSSIIFLIVNGYYIYIRSLEFAIGKFNNALKRVVFQTWSLLVLLLLGNLFSIVSFACLFNFWSTSLVVSLAFNHLVDPRNQKGTMLQNSCRDLNILAGFTPLLTITFSTFVDLVISNGGVVLIGYFENNEDKIINYIGAISVLSVPLTVLNSLLFPMAAKLNQLKHNNPDSIRKFLSFQIRKLVALLFCSFLGSMFVTPYILRLLFPGTLGLSFYELSIVWFGLATSFLTNYYRIVLVAFGKSRELIRTWSTSLLIFSALLYITNNGINRISYASISASLFIIMNSKSH